MFRLVRWGGRRSTCSHGQRYLRKHHFHLYVTAQLPDAGRRFLVLQRLLRLSRPDFQPLLWTPARYTPYTRHASPKHHWSQLYFYNTCTSLDKRWLVDNAPLYKPQPRSTVLQIVLHQEVNRQSCSWGYFCWDYDLLISGDLFNKQIF